MARVPAQPAKSINNALRAVRPAVELYGYQGRWFLDRSRFKAGMFARQTGKTFTTTLEIVDSAVERILQESTESWIILSRGERQAKEAIEEGVIKHAKAYQLGAELADYDWKSDGGFNYKAFEVRLPRGGRITALPANPDTARGFSRNVYLDEFAMHAKSKAIWGALFPVISAGFNLRITSTPKGKGNKFYEIMTGKDAVWSRHIVDIIQAVAEGLPRNVEELRSALADEDLWQQEFMLQWLDEASSFLTYDLILGCEDEDAGDPGKYAGGACYVGVDIARRNDLFVIWVWEEVGDVLWTRRIVELKNAPFAVQDAALDEVMTEFNVIRCAMDQTGMGEKPVEDAQRRYGAHRVEGVLLNGQRPLNIAIASKQRFEDRTVRIPAGNPVLRADLHKLKKVTGLTGAPRLQAASDSEGHADRTWAGFLGVAAASGAPPAFGAAVPPSKQSFTPRAGAGRPGMSPSGRLIIPPKGFSIRRP